MIGIGPFLPHHDTPFAACPPGNMEQTLLLLSIFRLMHPRALIPSTTHWPLWPPTEENEAFWQEPT